MCTIWFGAYDFFELGRGEKGRRRAHTFITASVSRPTLSAFISAILLLSRSLGCGCLCDLLEIGLVSVVCAHDLGALPRGHERTHAKDKRMNDATHYYCTMR